MEKYIVLECDNALVCVHHVKFEEEKDFSKTIPVMISVESYDKEPIGSEIGMFLSRDQAIEIRDYLNEIL